jgi:hypothetical protein
MGGFISAGGAIAEPGSSGKLVLGPRSRVLLGAAAAPAGETAARMATAAPLLRRLQQRACGAAGPLGDLQGAFRSRAACRERCSSSLATAPGRPRLWPPRLVGYDILDQLTGKSTCRR